MIYFYVFYFESSDPKPTHNIYRNVVIALMLQV
jgi:hypothetical protein